MLNLFVLTRASAARPALALIFAVLGLSFLSLQPARAATTRTVSSCTSYTDSGGFKEALDAAVSGDTIQFACSTDVNGINAGAVITIDKDLTIDATGQDVILSGGTSHRIFHHVSGSFHLIHLMLTLGASPFDEKGGAIWNEGGELIIDDSNLSNNPSGNGGGALYNTSPDNVYINNTTLYLNSSETNTLEASGGIENAAASSDAQLNISSSKFISNQSRSNHNNASGGAIRNVTGTLNISGSAFTSNFVFTGFGTDSQSAYGGAIDNWDKAYIYGSTFEGNSVLPSIAFGGGGAIYGRPGSTTLIANSTFYNNHACNREGAGGDCVDSSVLGAAGGAILVSSANLSIVNTSFADNQATGTAGYGGGVAGVGANTILLQNSYVTRSIGGDCSASGSTFTGADNRSDDGTCPGDVGPVTGVPDAPQIDDENGSGVTRVFMLDAGSNAVDAVTDCTYPAAFTPGIFSPGAGNAIPQDERAVLRPQGDACDIGSFEVVQESEGGGSSSSGSSSSHHGGQGTPAPANVSLCATVDGGALPYLRASVPSGAAGDASIYCRELTEPAQYGVLDQTVIHAVDVFALRPGGSSIQTFASPVQICLQGTGIILFRDANTPFGQERTTVALPSTTQADFTCANIPNAGTVILIQGTPSPAAPETTSPPSAGALANCSITTRFRINLRQSADASSPVLAQVPFQTMLKATARSGDWIQVVFGDTQGWLNVPLLTLDGDCG